jgi:transposase InsO family protein
LIVPLASFDPEKHIVLSVYLVFHDVQISTKALVDCGASSSFIDASFAKQHHIGLKKKAVPRVLEVVDGRPVSSGALTHETLPVQLKIGTHAETIQLDVTCLGHYPIILGMPWLTRHDPEVKWSQHQLAFRSSFCHRHCLKQPIALSSPAAIGPASPVPSPQSQPSPSPVSSPQSSPRSVPPSPQSSSCSVPAVAAVSSTSPALPDQDPASIVPSEYAEFADVFSKESASVLPPRRPYDHKIPLEPGTTPPFGPLYSLSEVELKALDEYLKENLAKGYIQASTSPAGAPILFVKKRDGSLRLCVDYRGLNKITVKNRYPLPLIGESLDRLRTATVFTKIDLRAGYYLVRIAEGDEWKTAFRTRYGHYEYRIMPFGLTNAPATFQNLMNDVLRDFLDDFAVVYLDDILIFSRSLDEHKRHVRRVLERLRANGLFAKPEKCVFHQSEVEYLGFLVSPAGIQMDPKKTSAILDWPEPASVRDVQIFIGFANFYRRFIRGFSTIAAPLTRLLQKDRTFVFDDLARQAFQQLKHAFTTAPVLAHFHPDRPSTIETDASDFAIAAVLSQPDADGVLHPVAFYSRKLTAAELNYEIYDKEMLAIITAIKEWRAYLEGAAHPFTVYTDHRNLEYFTTTKVLNRRQARWAEILGSYDFKIIYRPGASMGKPDAMTRRHDFSGGSKASDAPPRTLLKPGQLQLCALSSHDAPTDDESQLIRDIRASQPQDPRLQRLLPFLRDPEAPRDNAAQQELTGFSLRDGLVLFDGLVYVPDDDTIKLKILRQCHDAISAGHFGRAKTFEMVTRDFWWPRVRRFVKRYVSTCDVCARAKAPRHKPYGLLAPLPVPARAWSSISMDFIVGLPPSPSGHDAILVTVDRFTKMAHFSATKTTANAADVARLFLQDVYRLHGLPTDIVSDRDKIFRSTFWQHLLALLGVKPNMSTAFHPQTDGQTERVNQSLEQYLRVFCTYQQDNWQELLPSAEFAYNNAVHASTGKSPFLANYGYHPNSASTFVPRTPRSDNPAAEDMIKTLRDLHKQLALDLAEARDTQARFYNRKVKKAPPQFKEGKRVWLLRRNIKTTRPSDKLDYKRLGPFTIQKRIGRAAFRLKLPATMRIHPVFHVSLLEPVRANDIPGRVQEPSPPVIVEDHEEYEVEEVLDSRVRRGKLKYLVHWKNYPISDRTWEPPENLANAPDAVAKFHRAYPDKPHPGRLRPQAKARRARPRRGDQLS